MYSKHSWVLCQPQPQTLYFVIKCKQCVRAGVSVTAGAIKTVKERNLFNMCHVDNKRSLFVRRWRFFSCCGANEGKRAHSFRRNLNPKERKMVIIASPHFCVLPSPMPHDRMALMSSAWGPFKHCLNAFLNCSSFVYSQHFELWPAFVIRELSLQPQEAYRFSSPPSGRSSLKFSRKLWWFPPVSGSFDALLITMHGML